MQKSLSLFIFIGFLFSVLTINGANYAYRLQWFQPHTHTYLVTLKTSIQTPSYTDFKIPAWRPGRYILQDYAAAISHFEAQDGMGKKLQWLKVDKDTWRVMHANSRDVEISYRYFANNEDAGSSYLGEGQVYFNPINLFMYVDGRMDDAVEMEVPELPATWKVATSLHQEGKIFSAKSYHEFVDAPTVFAEEMKQMTFEIDGVKFFLHFQGEYQGDAKTDETILENVEKICREQAAIFGGFPFNNYHFIYRLLPYNLRHAVEHEYSSSYALPSTVSRSPRAAISGICGITAHEFWHVWNVKRIRPAALVPYDYSKPQYTSLHWFTEGVTDYYTNLTQVRTGIISEAEFLKRISNTISSLENSYAASVVSPSSASANSWLSSSTYAHPHHKISYYTLGSRMGFILDLALRSQSKGRVSLDDVFVYLYKTYYQKGQGFPEDGVQKAMETLTGISWQDFFDRYIHDTQSINYKDLMKPFGLIIDINEKSGAGTKMLGINQHRKVSQGVVVQGIYPGGDAARDGLGEGDLILTIDGQSVVNLDLNDYINTLKKNQTIEIKVFSDGRIKDLIIKYKGDNRPKTFSISTSNKPTALWETWIKTAIK